MKKPRYCKVCQRRISVGELCSSCRWSRDEYAKHWAVRELQFKVPKIKALKARKPLPGQLELFG